LGDIAGKTTSLTGFLVAFEKMVKKEKGFSAVIYYMQLNPVRSFFSLVIILLNTIIMNGRYVNWTSSSYISTGEDLLS
jgi:hypothetical protein